MKYRLIFRCLKKTARISWWVALCYKNWLNVPLTFFVNVYSLPLRQAVKLPIWLYGRPKLLALSGRVKLDCSVVYPGMIKINKTNESPSHSGGNTEIINKSEIVFRGSAFIGTGCRILVYAGQLLIGDKFVMNNRNYISCSSNVQIGDSTILGHEIQISDTNFHFLFDVDSNSVSCKSKSVVIGDFNWISNRVTIMKGVVTPNHTCVASNSLLNKRYDIPENSILAGSPAVIVKTGQRLIRKFSEEMDLFAYFKNNPERLVYYYRQEDFDCSIFES